MHNQTYSCAKNEKMSYDCVACAQQFSRVDKYITHLNSDHDKANLEVKTLSFANVKGKLQLQTYSNLTDM